MMTLEVALMVEEGPSSSQTLKARPGENHATFGWLNCLTRHTGQYVTSRMAKRLAEISVPYRKNSVAIKSPWLGFACL